MKVAIVADLHGNLPAVEAVHADIKRRGVDQIWCLGDMVGKGPSSPETLDWALAHCAVVLMGNWDEGILTEEGKTFDWYRSQLGQKRLEQIRALPFEHRLTFAGRHTRLLHGRPLYPQLQYSDSPIEGRMAFFLPEDGYRPQLVGYADVHRPFFQRLDCGALFNTGSVGNSLAGAPYATYAVMEEEGESFSFQTVELVYDRERAAQMAEGIGLPAWESYQHELRTGRYGRPVIKAAGPEDARELALVGVQSWRSAYRDILPQEYLDSLSVDQQTHHILSYMQTHPQEEAHHALWIRGEIVGTLAVHYESDLPGCGEIGAIYLLDEQRGRGRGRLLMEHALERMKQRGCTGALLWVLKENHSARRFYERMGFEPDGAEKQINLGKPVWEMRYLKQW